jgi:hypothetical protein
MSLEEARQVAQDLRSQRRDVVDAITRGDLAPTGFGHDPRVAGVKVVALAQVVPGVGKVRARRILEQLAVADGLHWGELRADQQRQVAEALTTAGAPPAGGP